MFTTSSVPCLLLVFLLIFPYSSLSSNIYHIHPYIIRWKCGQTLGLVSQTLFSLYLYNQWTDFHKLSCTGKPQMRAIYTYAGCTKATTNNWDIRPSVAVKASSANISWMAERIHNIKLALGSAHQPVSNNIWCISKRQVLVEIQAYQCSDIFCIYTSASEG